MKAFSRVLTVLGLVLVLLTGALAFAARTLPVTLLSQPLEAEQAAQTLVDALNQGDLSQARLILYGQPALADHPEFDNPFLTTVWNVYLGSLECQLEGKCYASDSGLYQDLTVEALDIQSALPEVESHYLALLPLRAASEAAETVYNDDGSYRETFVLSVLDAAAQEVLDQGYTTTSRTIALTLVYREDSWWILPQEGLMDILSGGFAGKEG